MTLEFDLASVTITEFGIGRDADDGETFCLVPIDAGAQAAIRDMALATWEGMRRLDDDPPQYQPSEKYAGTEHVYLPLEDALAERLRDLHAADNLPMDGAALADAGQVFCYFGRMTDARGRRLISLRRAALFKGILKSRNRLLRLVSDALQVIEDDVFKLDADFDLLVDGAHVHILRPSGFEFACKLQAAVVAAAPENIRSIRRDLPFVNFDSIQDYALTHPRAARTLASIRAQTETRNVNKTALKKQCRKTGVQIAEVGGEILVPRDEVMGFLEVLDRRRYEMELVRGSPERFRAGSRQRLDG